MLLADSHTHLYLPEFEPDRDEVIMRAAGSGITTMLMPNIDASSVDIMLSLSKLYPSNCYSMIGLHPTSVKKDYRYQLETIFARFTEYPFVAVGETGIDLYWDKTFINEQTEALRWQFNFALENDLPVVIHTRDAFPQLFLLLEEYRGSGLRGVLHAFSGNIADAFKAIEMGFMLGIGGPITFKNSALPEIIKETGAENIILETDSPYLAPVPFRGKRNESSYISLINRKLSEILQLTEEETAKVTYENTCRLFNIRIK